MRSRYTDLAMEAREGEARRTFAEGGIEKSVVRIETVEEAERYGRPQGVYVTLGCAQEMTVELRTRSSLADALARVIEGMLPEDAKTVLVAGLGNRQVTPDSLGPRTVERVLVSRHMLPLLPKAERDRMRCVCAVAPGVLGVTGVETAEVLFGMTAHVKPDCVIAVDALAARSSQRIGCTVQVTDTGIAPGSGVGNHQRALTRETLGVPVIAVGIPTVVYAQTIVSDALADAMDEMDEAIVERIVSQRLGEMIVTPREIDAIIGRMAGVVASGINKALHPGLGSQEIAQMMAE